MKLLSPHCSLPHALQGFIDWAQSEACASAQYFITSSKISAESTLDGLLA